jgi:murein DD-endopeptidase MepM/ murein hydrolase activator NlpD
MRHARKAAARATLAMLLSTTSFAISLTGSAQAILASGGTSAPLAAVATRGTGGTSYVAPSKAHPAGKPAHKPRRTRPSKPVVRSKPKVRPSQPGTPAPTPAPAPASEAGVPSPMQTAAEAAVFPVIGPHTFGNAENRFGAGRTGHIHEGQDVLASEGLSVVAPLAGTIVTTAYQAGGAGWYAAEHTVDGLDFFYAHCQAGSLAVSTGQAVGAGQPICRVGQTGDATGPHLHFEIWVGGWQASGAHPIDPLPYLEAWDHAPGG